MGNHCSNTNNNQQQETNYKVVPSGTQQVDNNVFYNRKLLLSIEQYYEHSKYMFLKDVWSIAVNNYKTASDQDVKKAINQNMNLLIDDHNFKLVRRYISVLMTSELVPSTFKYIYKLARIRTDEGNILYNAVALVTMRLDVQRASIADSYTGSLINHEQLVDNKEYCCNKAEVYAFKIVGEQEEVMQVIPSVLDNTYTIVSNFDSEFQYVLGHHITEPNFKIRGTGCYQGIHFFTNEDAAVKYTNKGMINKILELPHITKSLRLNDLDERTLSLAMLYLEHGTRNITTRVSKTAEALLKYYNSVHNAEAHRNLKNVCNDMYGDWYLKNNFGVNSGGGYSMKINLIPDLGMIQRTLPPAYEV